MDTVLGIRGKDFVLLSTDMAFKRSIVIMNDEQARITEVSDNLMFITIGDGGDPMQFADYISRNITLYKIRNGYDLTPLEAMHFTRKNLADFLRSRTPYNVYLLMAGYDKQSGPLLYYMDYLANSKSVKFGGHGFGSMFATSIMQRYWHEDLTLDEALEILRKCIYDIHKRLVINLRNFHVAVVDKFGVRKLSKITTQTLIQYNPVTKAAK